MTDEGNYTLTVTNWSGRNTVIFPVQVMAPRSVAAWGDDSHLQLERSETATNFMQVSGGGYHSMAVTDSGSVLACGENSYAQTNMPAGLTSATAVSEGVFTALRCSPTGVCWACGFPNKFLLVGRTANFKQWVIFL